MWDLGKEIGQLETAKILFKSIDFITPSGKFDEWFRATLLADKELNEGENACRFTDILKNRGFEERLKEAKISCTDFIVPTALY